MIRKRVPVEERFWKYIDKDDTICESIGSKCWNWTGASHPDGYGLLGKGGKKDGLIRATHVSWNIHIGVIPDGMWVLHKCDNPPCCNPEHLFLGNAKDNAEDCLKKGRYVFLKPRYGLENNKGKLSDEQVAEIRESFANTVLPPRRHGRVAIKQQLADKYGVSMTQIKDIISRKTSLCGIGRY